ncbi:MAG: CAP domain-containing protein [Patescibacteria group bacterium]|nr:CAP domain-containing protein [Patescibacteria group bacterium]
MNIQTRSVFLWTTFVVLTGVLFFFLGSTSEKNENQIGEPSFLSPIVKGSTDQEGFLTHNGVVTETNKQRELFLMNTLQENEDLNRIAMLKLENMFREGYFAHISPDGDGVNDIAKEEGYEYLFIGDNLAIGPYEDDEELLEAWMNSDGHRENILNEVYTEIGVAVKKDYYEGRETWIAVQVFGAPFSICPVVDDQLEVAIEEKRNIVKGLKDEIDQLKIEIDNMEDKTGEEYNQKAERCDNSIVEYNGIVNEITQMINNYNKKVKERQECLRSKGLK